MVWARIAGSFCLIVGLSLIAGFVSQFRERGYVGWLGLSFLALAVSALSSQTNLTARNIALAAAGVFFLLSFISAVQQTRQRLAAIRRRQNEFEDQMIALLEAERARREKESGEKTGE